jgi:hypothetical protein
MADPLAKNGSSVSTGARVGVALMVALFLGLFVLFIEWQYLGVKMYYSIGILGILPVLAVALSFGGNCLIQELSCSKVSWFSQFTRSLYILIPLYLSRLVLDIIPILRWPVEGLVQTSEPSFRRGLSSGFYTFWVALYSQGLMNGLAQMC